MPTTILKTRNGVLDAADQAQFAALNQRLAAGGAKVWLHLHGGLVDEAKGVEIAERLRGPAPDGFGLGADWEQVYVVWRTGALETIKANWTDLYDNDRVYMAVLKKLLDFAAGKLGLPGDAAGRSAFTGLGLTPSAIAARLAARPPGDPFGDVDLALEIATPEGRGPAVATESDGAIVQEFMLLLQRDLEFNLAADDIAAALATDEATGRSLSPRGDAAVGQEAFRRLDERLRAGLEATVPPDAPSRALFTGFQVAQFLIKHAGRIALRVMRRFRTRRDHGFYATVVEELVREFYGDLIGAAIWGMMKRDGADHFSPGGLGTALFAAMAANAPARLSVSAHSAGSIWASQMLIALAAQGASPRMKIAFMAPAVRLDLFAEAVKRGGQMVEALHMFTMRDELERQDPVLGTQLAFLYPSSLLYLVSGAFEDLGADAFPDAPLLGMQRFLTHDAAWLSDPQQIAAVGVAMSFLASPNNGVVFATTSGGPGLSTQATSHGDFDQDHDTLASVAFFLK